MELISEMNLLIQNVAQKVGKPKEAEYLGVH